MSLPSQDPLAGAAGEYRRFARLEARGHSPAYEALAMAVAADRPVLAFLASLPPGKRQPNLLFAAARSPLRAGAAAAAAGAAGSRRERGTHAAGGPLLLRLRRAQDRWNRPGRAA